MLQGDGIRERGNRRRGQSRNVAASGESGREGHRTEKVIVSGNIVRSSYFIRADSPPKNCIIKNNVADYDFAEPYLNMDDESNIFRDNILTNF